MKLYTEEQMSIAINCAKANPSQAHLILEQLTPIELPSDMEIWEEADKEESNSKHYAFTRGAKWMRNKIQGGNNVDKNN